MDPSAGSGPRPGEGCSLVGALRRFARDSFGPRQARPIFEILTSAGLADSQLIFGLAAESAGDFVTELRLFTTATGLGVDCEPFQNLFRIISAHARAAADIRSKGITPGTGDPPDLVTRDRNFRHLSRVGGGGGGQTSNYHPQLV